MTKEKKDSEETKLSKYYIFYIEKNTANPVPPLLQTTVSADCQFYADESALQLCKICNLTLLGVTKDLGITADN